MNNREIYEILKKIKYYINTKKIDCGKLSKIIDKYLIPTFNEKQTNAEVSTPYILRKEMLDTIPDNFWNKPRKIFEPCCGKGGFVVDIINRFDKGLKKLYPNNKKRYKVIIEDCLYFSDISRINVYICEKLISCYGNFKINSNVGDTIKLNIRKKWNLKNFDAVIGNPPYNEDSNKSNDNHQKPIYQNWVYKLLPLCTYLLFITPSKWFSSSDNLLIEFRDFMKTAPIQFIKHYSNDDVFKNAVIKGGVSYYLINKKYSGLCLFNNLKINMKKYDIILEPKFYKLIDEIKKKNQNSLSDIYCSQGIFLNDNTEKLIENHSKKNNIPVYVSKAKGFKKYINKNLVKINNFWKVATTAAAYSGTSGFGNTFIIDNTEIHSRSYISFKVNNEKEAKSLLSYLKCKLPNILLSTRKITHTLSNRDLFKWIPLPSLNIIWSDKKIYSYFKLSKDVINIIENTNIEGFHNN